MYHRLSQGTSLARLHNAKKISPASQATAEAGMGDHAEHAKGMAIPANSIPMVGANGPYDYITMGGMFTILKVRDNLTSYADPGWYKAPLGTVAQAASKQELKRDGIEV